MGSDIGYALSMTGLHKELEWSPKILGILPAWPLALR